MPTAAHLFAAVLFAALGWTASELVKGLMDPDTQFGIFSELNAALAGFLGWKIIGPRAKNGLRVGFSAGLTCGVVVFVAAAFLHSFRIMLVRSSEGRYKEPVEAVMAGFELMVELARPVATPEVLGVLIVGGIGAGLVSSAISRVWS